MRCTSLCCAHSNADDEQHSHARIQHNSNNAPITHHLSVTLTLSRHNTYIFTQSIIVPRQSVQRQFSLIACSAYLPPIDNRHTQMRWYLSNVFTTRWSSLIDVFCFLGWKCPEIKNRIRSIIGYYYSDYDFCLLFELWLCCTVYRFQCGSVRFLSMTNCRMAPGWCVRLLAQMMNGPKDQTTINWEIPVLRVSHNIFGWAFCWKDFGCGSVFSDESKKLMCLVH